MQPIIASPRTSLLVGLGLAAAGLGLWLMTAGAAAQGLFSFLIRLLQVLGAMVRISLVFLVNFVQLVALQSADEQAREVLHKAIFPNVAWWCRNASTLTVASGAVLLVTSAYLLPSLIYGTGVYVPPSRA